MNLKHHLPPIKAKWLTERGRKPLDTIYKNITAAILLMATSIVLAKMANWQWPSVIQPLVTPSLVLASVLAGWQGLLGYGSDTIELFTNRKVQKQLKSTAIKR